MISTETCLICFRVDFFVVVALSITLRLLLFLLLIILLTITKIIDVDILLSFKSVLQHLVGLYDVKHEGLVKKTTTLHEDRR